MSTCRKCGVPAGPGGVFKHMADVHPEEFAAMQMRGLKKMHPGKFGGPPPPGDSTPAQETGDKGGPAVAEKTKGPPPKTSISADAATFFSVVPKTFTFSSMLLQMTKKICEAEWNWPELEVGDFLDTYLFWSMKQRGIVIGGYQVINKNGHGQEETVHDG